MNKMLFDQSWNEMINEGLNMDCLVVKQNRKLYKHVFSQTEERANIRSISKPITCLCFGIAIDSGMFQDGVDEKVFKYLTMTQHIHNTANIDYIKDWTLKTLLTLTIGFENKMLDSKHLPTIAGENYADVVLNSPLFHKSGEYFLYSNAAMYLASVVFQNATGYKLFDFAFKHIFSPLGISEVSWAESPQGYNMGCTGIEMYAEDLCKIGQLLRDHGLYKRKRIVSEEWVKSMLTPQVLTPSMYDEKRVLPKYAYGLNMWICKDGIAYCDGTDGQYLIVVPHLNLVIVTTGHQHDMKPITRCLERIIRADK